MAQVGQPQLKILEDSKDGKTRWVQLQVPITEGKRYAVGDFKFEGNKVVNSEALRPLFKIEAGETYSQKKVKKGLEKAQEVYGSGGYFEFTAYPGPAAARRADGTATADAAGPPSPGPPSPGAAPAAATATTAKDGTPLVDVTMRVDEGKQYFVNRITFTGNTTTRDNVIRREMRLVEAGVFNTQALKDSVKRLNQLGYFKPLEGEAVDVQKTPNADNKVDIGLKFEEQNRNQLTFGAGVSQFDGFFGQLSFQTSNFLGRGETFSVTAQQGNRAKNYQVAFTEPFLFDRPMTAGVDLFSREIRYEGQFTQASLGGNVVFGFQVMPYARMFVNYSLEQVEVKDLNPLYRDPLVLAGNPFLAGFAAHRRRRQADHQQDRAELRLQHRRPPDLPDHRHALHAVDGLGGPRRQHELRESAGGRRSGTFRSAPSAGRRSGFRAQARVHHAVRQHHRAARSSSGCSSAASTACAGSTSARSVRAIRSPASSSAATRACCSTSST